MKHEASIVFEASLARIFVVNIPAVENALSLSTEVGLIERSTLYQKSQDSDLEFPLIQNTSIH